MKIRIKLLILFLIAGAGTVVASNMGWFEYHNVPSDVSIQIHALATRNYEIDSLKDTGETYKIKLMLSEVPKVSEAEKWTLSVCADAHAILRGTTIKRNISVKSYVHLWGGKTQFCGETYYDKSTHRYEFMEGDK